jgi:hypothetical protein
VICLYIQYFVTATVAAVLHVSNVPCLFDLHMLDIQPLPRSARLYAYTKMPLLVSERFLNVLLWI